MTQPPKSLPLSPSARATLLRIALGIVVGGGALWLAFREVDLAVLVEALRGLHFGWTTLALLSVLAMLMVSTVRWRLLFYPDQHSPKWVSLFWGIVVGQMLNIVVPLRLGEAARVVIASSDPHIAKTRTTATLVVEKVADLAAYALAGLLILATWSAPLWFQQSAAPLVVTGVAAVLGLVGLGLAQEPLRRWIAARAGGAGWQHRGWTLADRMLTGLGVQRNWQANLALGALTTLVLLLSASTNYFMFLAFQLPLSFGAALFLLLVLQIGIAPPSLPGKLGVFHYLTALTLSLWAVDRSVALSYAFALYGVALLSKVALGSIWFLVRHPAKIGG